jgi:hypothetical protein
MEGRPFVFLGVNCDDDKESVKQAALRQNINWRNWCNGGARGPFTSLFSVTSWPTTLVLDAEGVVKFRGRPGPEMEQLVENLVGAVESSHQAKGATSSARTSP